MRARAKTAAALMVVLSASLGAAQTQKNQARWFTVKGTVVDEKERPVASAKVSLKDTGSRKLKIKAADRDGRFSFTWLDARLDYEIYAESEDAASDKVLISGLQKPQEVVVKLKLVEKANSFVPLGSTCGSSRRFFFPLQRAPG